MSEKHVCEICGYVYNEADGEVDSRIEPGTPFEDIDEYDFRCPVCGSDKHMFTYMEENE